MSRRSFLGLLGVAAAAGACSTSGLPAATSTLPAGTPPLLTPTPVPSPTPGASDGLDEQIAQMVMAGFRGLSVGEGDSFAAELARGLGTAVLFDYDVPLASPVRNVESPAQVAQLAGELQSLGTSPLLVAVDEEGGQVARLDPDHGFPATLSEGELGRRNDLDQTRANAEVMAGMLASAGINLNLAPVVDLNVNPSNPIIGSLDRSFSADPDVVTEHVLAVIQAHHDAGVLTTLKHFPGHGSSTADSHIGFVDVTGTWSRTELEPFANIIGAGEADVVMTAHVFNANLDPDYPATLSHATITGLLRDELGYDGVVISDDVQMGAIREQYGFEEAIKLSVNAGVDIIAIANNTIYEEGAAGRAMDVIRAAVDSGEIDPGRIEEANQRISGLKARLA